MRRELTEKQLKNKRFRNTEEAILLAYCIAKDNLSPGRIAHLAHISRSTFYRHHQSTASVATDYEAYIYRKATSAITHLLKIKHLRLSTIYNRLLIFISANRRVMSFIIDFGSSDFLSRLLLILEPKLTSATKLQDEELLQIYISEVASLIKSWRSSDFNCRQIPTLVNKIDYLTDTASIRLRPVALFNYQHDA